MTPAHGCTATDISLSPQSPISRCHPPLRRAMSSKRPHHIEDDLEEAEALIPELAHRSPNGALCDALIGRKVYLCTSQTANGKSAERPMKVATFVARPGVSTVSDRGDVRLVEDGKTETITITAFCGRWVKQHWAVDWAGKVGTVVRVSGMDMAVAGPPLLANDTYVVIPAAGESKGTPIFMDPNLIEGDAPIPPAQPSSQQRHKLTPVPPKGAAITFQACVKGFQCSLSESDARTLKPHIERLLSVHKDILGEGNDPDLKTLGQLLITIDAVSRQAEKRSVDVGTLASDIEVLQKDIEAKQTELEEKKKLKDSCNDCNGIKRVLHDLTEQVAKRMCDRGADVPLID